MSLTLFLLQDLTVASRVDASTSATWDVGLEMAKLRQVSFLLHTPDNILNIYFQVTKQASLTFNIYCIGSSTEMRPLSRGEKTGTCSDSRVEMGPS